MAIKLVNPAEAQRYERILIYGDPKTGKTRLATSLPAQFGDILYVAADAGSEALASVLSPYLDRLHVLKPTGGADPKSNPHYDAFEIANRDWSKEFSNVRTLIWDTMTATSLEILNYVATTGQFSQGGVGLGTPNSPEYQKLPQPGDYLAAQNITSRLTDFLFRQPLHLIVICHATFDEPREGGSVEGGPATSGKATVRSFPGRFDSVLYISRKSSPAIPGVGTSNNPSPGSVTVHTERNGIWSAGVRSSHPTNPMPKIGVGSDPQDFWLTFLKHHNPKLLEAK